MYLLPNIFHPGPRCSCRECIATYTENDVDEPFVEELTGGNSAGNESTEPGSAKYAACVDRLEKGIVQYALAYAYAPSAQDKVSLIREAAEAVLEVCRAFEEGQRGGEGSHGEAEKDAPEKVELPGGRQLTFELFCMKCHFQCWDCPACRKVRCACRVSRCSCVVDAAN